MRSRWLYLGLGLAIVVALIPLLRRPMHATRMRWALHRFLNATDHPSARGVRFSRSQGWAPNTDARTAAEALYEVSVPDRSAEARHATGLALLVLEKPSEAIPELRAAASSGRSAQWWSDLAAGELLFARNGGGDEHLFAALVALDQARDVDPWSPEARFNLAVLCEELGLRLIAQRQWRLFLATDSSDSQWANEARKRLRINEQTATEAGEWREAEKNLQSMSSAQLTQLTKRVPQYARRAAEGPLLGDWTDAIERGDLERAEKRLAVARTIGNALREYSGDALLADMVANIDGASVQRRKMVADAHATYVSGRLALKTKLYDQAATILGASVRRLAHAGSPFAGVASYYHAIALRLDNRTAEARAVLEDLIAETDSRKFLSLTAQIRNELSLVYGTEGRWDEAETMANKAVAEYRRLGERENVGEVGLLLIGISERTGQGAEAVAQILETFHVFSAAGAEDRLAGAMAVAGHTEVRRRRWAVARALARLERESPHTMRNAEFRTDNLIRLATIEFHLGRTAAANESITAARIAAQKLPRPLQPKVTADIDAVAGAIVSRSDPGRAIPLFERSIAFQRKAGRSYALSETLLASGRARWLHKDTVGAAADFEAGIEILEQQRANTVDASRKIGIFDNAMELFDEAALLALDRGDSERAFSYVERRRARTLLDELVTDRDRLPTLAGVNVRAALPKDTTLLEYVQLKKQLFVFVMTRNGLTVKRLAEDSGRIERELAQWFTCIRERTDSRPPLTALHASLVAPIESLLTTQNLIVVPDSLVQSVPFAALLNSRTDRYLLEQYAIVRAPSASSFLAAARKDIRLGKDARIVAFGNPDPGSTSNLDTLPRAELEATIVARAYAKRDVLVKESATSTAFADALRSGDAVHYAGHAVSNAGEPWRSSLALSSQWLTAREIVNVDRVRARIVVLAACGTARGGGTVVENSPVLAHSLLLAGVGTVIGTLWDIEDGEATALMSVLHAGLSKGVAPSVALREAQLAMLHADHRENRDPARWSAFAAMGAP